MHGQFGVGRSLPCRAGRTWRRGQVDHTRAAANAFGRGNYIVNGQTCDAIAVGTPDYFSYMAGGLKDFFDRTYYPTQDQVTGKPCAIFVRAEGTPSCR